MSKILSKKDAVFLCVSALFSALLCFFVYSSLFSPDAAKKTAVISRSGKIVHEMKLSEDGTFLIEDLGFEVTVRDGCAFVSRSPCKGRYCVNSGRISRPGAAVICVPCEITVTVRGEESAIDGVAG